jgi:hypothetical protein
MLAISRASLSRDSRLTLASEQALPALRPPSSSEQRRSPSVSLGHTTREQAVQHRLLPEPATTEA